MSARVETICVDIGNSGLRCMRLAEDGTGHRGGAATPWSGEILRIDWPLGSPATDAVGSGSPSLASHSNRDAQADEPTMVAALEQWLAATAKLNTKARGPRRWVVSSVQRATESHFRSCVARLDGGEYRLLTLADLELEVDVDFPERVGMDRLLAASAALKHCAARPLIVIQVGSAVTVDWVEAPRRFCGGAILPGVPMMLRLLSRAADMLPDVAADELLDLPGLPGRNTAAAMAAGVSSAVVGGVQHLVARYRSQFGAETPIVLSGGDGPRLAPHLAAPVEIVDHLVLRGLAASVMSEIRRGG